MQAYQIKSDALNAKDLATKQESEDMSKEQSKKAFAKKR